MIRTVETPRTFRTTSAASAELRETAGQSTEHGLAADAAVQEGVERYGAIAPGGFELDLAVESPLGHQRQRRARSPAPLACQASSSKRFSV